MPMRCSTSLHPICQRKTYLLLENRVFTKEGDLYLSGVTRAASARGTSSNAIEHDVTL